VATIRSNYPMRFYCLAAGAPGFVLFAFGALLLRARIGLGRWPTPYVDVPGADVNFYFAAVVCGVLWFLLCPGLMLVLHLFIEKSDRASLAYRCATLSFLLSTAALVWLVIADPGRVVDWFID
jgi:hypothetical protein